MIIGHIIQASHVSYISYWFPSQPMFQQLEQILSSYLWSKYGGGQGLPLIQWDLFMIPKGKWGHSLIDVATQGDIPIVNWVVYCLEGFAP